MESPRYILIKLAYRIAHNFRVPRVETAVMNYCAKPTRENRKAFEASLHGINLPHAIMVRTKQAIRQIEKGV